MVKVQIRTLKSGTCYILLLLSCMMPTVWAAPLNMPLMDNASPVTINGTIAPSEWENAGATPIALILPDNRVFGVCMPLCDRNVTVYALHDNFYLYLGFIVKDETGSNDSSTGTINDGIILMFDPNADGSSSLLPDDKGYSFFVVPNAATPDSATDVTLVSSNTHTVSGAVWDTTAGPPAGPPISGVLVEFSNVNDGGEHGWQMEVQIPFAELNSIDPNTVTNGNIGFAFLIVNDYGDSPISLSIEPCPDPTASDVVCDNDGYLAFPTGVSTLPPLTPPSPGTPVLTPDFTVTNRINTAGFNQPSTWDHDPAAGIQFGIHFERPNLLVTPTAIAPTDVVRVGESDVLPITVQNNGPATTTLQYTLPTLSAPFSYTATGSPTPGVQVPLAGGISHNYEIQFSPTVVGAVPTQTETIASNDEPVDITLDGEGGLPVLEVTGVTGSAPSFTLDFEDVIVSTTESIGINITNTGNVPLDITNVSVSGSAQISFTLSDVTDGANQMLDIPPGAPEQIIIECAPTSVGTLAATTLTFNSDDPNLSNVTVNINCKGVSRELVVMLDDSGSMRVRTPSGDETPTLTGSRWRELESATTELLDMLVEYGTDQGKFNTVYFPEINGDPYQVELAFPSGMQPIDSDNRGEIITDMAAVTHSPSPKTPIGTALGVGVNQFAVNNSKRAMILFSDGFRDGGDEPSAHYDAIKNSGARVYTLGYGAVGSFSVDMDLLSEIATLTEQPGEDNSYEVNAEATFDLTNTFKKILSDEMGLDLDVDPEGIISSNQVVTRNVVVNDLNDQLTFHLDWNSHQQNRLNFSLLTPDCRLITPSVAASDPDIKYYSRNKFKLYSITGADVKSGTWQVIINRPASGSEPYSYGLTSRSSLRFNAVLNQSFYYTGDNIKIEASLQGRGIPITGATVYMNADKPKYSLDNWVATNYVSDDIITSVATLDSRQPQNVPGATPSSDIAPRARVAAATATGTTAVANTAVMQSPAYLEKKSYALKHVLSIKPPTGNLSSRIYLHDDGKTGGDKVANDGIYTTTVSENSVSGTYDFHLYAQGKTPGGFDFTRETIAQRQVKVGWRPELVYYDYQYKPLIINEEVQNTLVLNIHGTDPFGNLSVDTQTAKDLKIQVSGGTLSGGVYSNGDGSFSQVILLDDKDRAPSVAISYRDSPLLTNTTIPVPADLTFVNKVANYKPGKEGKPGFNQYTNVEQATGTTEAGRSKPGFVSLGGGGSITLAIADQYITDGPGTDIVVYEVTALSGSAEMPDAYSVEVKTRQGFVRLGRVAGGTAEFDLADKGIKYASQIRIIDESNSIADARGKLMRSPGADIEAVGVRTTSNTIPDESSGEYQLTGIVGMTYFDSKLGLDDGPVLGVRWDYPLTRPWTLQLEAAVTSTDDDFDQSGTMTQLFVSGRYDLKKFMTGVAHWRPYVSAGVGYAFFRGFGADDEAFAAHLSAGAFYPVRPNLDLGFEARSIQIQDISDLGSSQNSQANVLLKFKF